MPCEQDAAGSSPVLEKHLPTETANDAGKHTQPSGRICTAVSWTAPKHWASSFWDFDRNKSECWDKMHTATANSE
jgi:hypothetical protein